MKNSVEQYYDFHPINYQQIISSLESKYHTIHNLTQNELSNFDQDHYQGSQAIDLLAKETELGTSCYVLDLGCGVGGSSRYLAFHYGCQVLGLDITKSRIDAAMKLTDLTNLNHLVQFKQGDAMAMPLADKSFDVIIGQEAWVHIPDKKRLFNECSRVIKPRGKLAFTDIIIKDSLTNEEIKKLSDEMACFGLVTSDDYKRYLKEASFLLLKTEDLSPQWIKILSERLVMYRNLKEHTIKEFGADYYHQWDATYAFYVNLFAMGKLGGIRYVAQASED